jgi:hypothetical protein
MKILIQAQIIVSWIAFVLSIYPVFLAFIWIIPAIPVIGILWIGFRLLRGYYKVNTGDISIWETQQFFWGSLCFR